METLRLSTESADIEQAGEIIRNGGLVAFPTETVYGLGANALDEEAVKTVYLAKGRPSDNPMIVHIAETSELELLVAGGMVSLGEDVFRLMNEVWPGPLTMVFPKSAMVPDITTGGLDTVAVRMPSNGTASITFAKQFMNDSYGFSATYETLNGSVAGAIGTIKAYNIMQTGITVTIAGEMPSAFVGRLRVSYVAIGRWK